MDDVCYTEDSRESRAWWDLSAFCRCLHVRASFRTLAPRLISTSLLALVELDSIWLSSTWSPTSTRQRCLGSSAVQGNHEASAEMADCLHEVFLSTNQSKTETNILMIS